MEWAKAKTILIITFFILNLILGYQLWIHTKVADSYFAHAEIREEMHQLLRSKNIRLQSEIPRETPRLREMTVTFADAYNLSAPVELDPPVDAPAIARGIVPDVLAKQIPMIDQYEYDPMLSEDGTVVLYQLYDERWPMFEINLELHHDDDNRVYQYQQYYGEVESEQGEEELEVLSGYKVVAFLAENVLPVGAVIREVQLGYHGQVYDSDMQVLAPKWRIVLGDGEVYYVHAINGELE